MATNNAIGNRTYTLTSDTAITATTGNITATLGDIVITNGKLSVGGVTGTDGQVLLAATGANPAWASVSAGSGISITPGANTLSIASTAPLTWAQVGVDGALVVNQNTVNSKVGLLTMSLPATAAINTVIGLVGWGAGGWAITQAANQQILIGNTNTTLGAGGSLASTDKGDCVFMVCVTADLVWRVFDIVGNITVV